MSSARTIGYLIVAMVLGVFVGGLVFALKGTMNASILRGQIQNPAPVFLQGGTFTVPAGTPAFIFCGESSRDVPISLPQGTLQVYEFTGYEWALAVIGQPSFPGARLTLVNNIRPDPRANAIQSFRSETLYYLLSTVSFPVNCTAGTMGTSGAATGGTPGTTGPTGAGANCKPPSCPVPRPGCSWTYGNNDPNGCPTTCGTLQCN